MNIFVGCVGHPDLCYSMYALFEKRIGATVYVPLEGKDWEERGISVRNLREIQDAPMHVDEVCHLHIPSYGYTHRAITFEQFLEIDFDVLVVTSWVNEEGFSRLREQYKPRSRYVRHIANAYELPQTTQNVLLSTLEPMPSGTNWIRHHPEHLEGYYPQAIEEKVIKTFSHRFPIQAEDLEAWGRFKSDLPEFAFRMHGDLGEDGRVLQEEMPEAVRSSMFVWHTKAVGGCGYVLRQALSCGKPCIVRRRYSHCYNALAINLLYDGVNCIDIDSEVRPIEESIRLVKEWSEPGVYAERCRIVLEAFEKDVNFEAEALSIGKWLEGL